MAAEPLSPTASDQLPDTGPGTDEPARWTWSSQEVPSRIAGFAPLATGVVALVLGLAFLARRSLTTDEAVAIDRTSGSLGAALRSTFEHEPGALLSTLLLHPLVRVSVDARIVRAPSVAALVVATLLAFLVARRLHGPVGGITAALVVATAAPAVAAAQSVGMVAAGLAWALLATWLLVRAFDEETPARWATYAAVGTLMPLFHPACAAVLVGHFGAVAVRSRGGEADRRLALSAIAVPTVVSVILLGAIAADRWADGSGTPIGEIVRAPWAATGWNPILGLLAIGGLVATMTGRGSSPGAWKAALEGGMILGPLAVVGLAALLLPVYGQASGTIALAGTALAVGACVSAFATSKVVIAAIAAAGAVTVGVLAWWYLSTPDEDWKRAAAAVSDGRPADSIVVLPERSRSALARELPGSRLRLRATGDVVTVVIRDDADAAAAAAVAREIVPTPRYALLEQRRISDEIVVQRWVRP